MTTPPGAPQDPHSAGPPPPGPPSVGPPAPQVDGTLGGLIPYKNSSALIAYYLGVFSIIPCLGIVLGLAGFVLGLKGLKFAKAHPEAKGKTHAWVGILMGGLFGFGYLAAVLWLAFAAHQAQGR